MKTMNYSQPRMTPHCISADTHTHIYTSIYLHVTKVNENIN